MISILATSLKTGVLTEANPFGGAGLVRVPGDRLRRCTACDDCARACPTGAIQAAAPRARA